MADGDAFQIILEKVPQEKQPETALFLSGCFSLPPSSTRGIADSGPIALVSDLPKAQAEAVLAELAPSVPPGVELRLSGGEEADKVSRLQWPRPPRIYGRDLADFAAPACSEIACPHCGGGIRVCDDGAGGFKAVPVAKGEPSARIEPASENDFIFSGVKPLAHAEDKLASLRSLEAGDTGFWFNYDRPPEPPPAAPPAETGPGESSNAKRSTDRLSVGLAAFMKPGAFAVVVSRTRDNQAVKMIAEIMGISESEARDKCMNLGFCVARDISLDEAQNLLARFKSLGARARIVKPG